MKKVEKKAIPLFGIAITLLFLYLVIVAGFFVITLMARVLGPIGITLGIVSILLVAIPIYVFNAYYSWKNFRYKFDEDGYHQESGVFFKHSIFIPYEKIAQIDVRQGPLERFLGFASLRVYAVAQGQNARSLSGRVFLPLSEAQELKNHLLKKIK